MIGRGRPSTSAVRSRISRPERTSGPGTPNHSLPSTTTSSAPRTATTTSLIATGSVRDFSQRGKTITGSLAARSRTMSQLRLPWPMIMLARSSMALTLPERRVSPTSPPTAKMCGGIGARGCDTSEVDDAAHPGVLGGAQERLGLGDLRSVEVAARRRHSVHEVQSAVASFEGAYRRVPICDVGGHPVAAGPLRGCAFPSRVAQRTSQPAATSAG